MELVSAADKGDIEKVCELVPVGIDCENKNGETALIRAAFREHTEIVKILLSAGANVNHTDKKGNTALSWAVFFGNDVITSLINAGANVNHVTGDGNTALITAAFWGRENIVRILIDANVQLDYRAGDYGDTALMMAIQRGYTNVSRVLIDAGANVNIKNNYDTTPLMIASLFLEDIIPTLLSAGAEINVSTSEGESAITLAAQYNKKAMGVLLEAGAIVTDTALQLIESKGVSADIIKQLTECQSLRLRQVKRAKDYRHPVLR